MEQPLLILPRGQQQAFQGTRDSLVADKSGLQIDGVSRWTSSHVITILFSLVYLVCHSNALTYEQKNKLSEGSDESAQHRSYLSGDHVRRRLTNLFTDSENGMMIRISGARGDSSGPIPFDNSNPDVLSRLDNRLTEPGGIVNEMIPLINTGISQPSQGSQTRPTIGSNDDSVKLIDANTTPRKVPANFKALRVQGDGGLYWIPVIVEEKTFVLITTDQDATPAHLILPEGQQVLMVSSEADKSLELDFTTAAIVSYAGGSYIAITSFVLSKLKTLPVYAWHQPLPLVTYHSHGLINIGDKISAQVVKDTRIQVADSLLYRNLFAAVRSENQGFEADYLTSRYGYMLYRFPNQVQPGEFDAYRVCMYCVRLLANHSAEVAAIFGGSGNAQKLTVGAANASEIANQLQKHYIRNFNTVMNIHFIPERYEEATSIILTLNTSAGHFELSKQELKDMYEAKTSGSARLDWFRTVSLDDIASGKTHENCFVMYQTIGCINRGAVEDFVKQGAEKTDPALDGKVSPIDGDEFYYKNGLKLSESQVQSLIKELPDPTRLILPSWSKVSSRGWPSLMVKVDHGTVNQYFVNVELLKTVFDVPIGYFKFSQISKQDLQSNVEFLKQREGVFKPKPALLAAGQPELTKTVYNTSGVTFSLTEDMAQKLSVSLPNYFKRMSGYLNAKPNRGQRVVVIHSVPYLFDSDRFLETLTSNRFASTEEMDGVYQTLGLKSENVYVVQVNDSLRLQGRCVGKYVDKTSCDGNFIGQASEKNKDGTWRVSKPFDGCTGVTSSAGCQGVYTDRSLAVKNTSVVIKGSKDSSYNFETQSGFSTISGSTNTIKVDGNCSELVHFKNQVCTMGTLEVHNMTKLPNEHIRMVCSGKLQFSDLSCSSGSTSFQCIGTWDYSKDLLCNGTMITQSCPGGGTVQACNNPTDPDNKMVRCDSLWNGRDCDYNWVYVPASNNAYSYGACRGEKIANTRCSGLFRGNYTKCNDALTAGQTCTGSSQPLYFQCDGLMDSRGCQGSMTSQFSLAFKEYSSTVESRKVPLWVQTGRDGHFVDGLVYNQSVLSGEQDGTTYKVTCRDQLDITAGTCRGMEFVHVNPKPKVVTTRVVCKQDSVITDVSCKNGYYSISECTGVDRPSASLLCNGTFKMISCMDGGGTGFNCSQPDKQSQDVICTGLWDGSKCIGEHSPQLIKIPNDLYLHGFCDGNFKINISCTGRFYDANYYTCSKDPYTVQDFKSVCFFKAKFGECQGLLDSTGCKGSYSDTVLISGKQMDMKSTSDSHFDFKNIAGNVTFKVSKPSKTDTRGLNITATKIRCRVGALLSEKVCMGAEYIYSAQEWKSGSPETTTTIFMKCPGNLTLEGLKCPANMSVSTCRGSSPDPEPSERMGCIGDFHQKVCVNGGTELACAADSSINRYVECNGQTWDGNTCVDSQSGPWSGFSRKEGPLLRDSEGNDLKSVRYITKEFTLNKPSIKKLSVENCTVKSVHLQTGSRIANGSYEDMHSPPSYNSFEISQGDLVELVFSNLQLDDVDFAEINKDPSVKVIQLQIETLIISEAAGLQVELKNFLAKSLEVGESVSHDVKIGYLSLLNSKTSLKLSNVTINFPVVSSDVAKAELDKPDRSRSIRLPFYDVGLYMADFIFKLKPGGSLSTKNFIEFPEYKLERLKVGEMSAKHFTLGSRQLRVESTGSGSTQAPGNQGQTPNVASTKP